MAYQGDLTGYGSGGGSGYYGGSAGFGRSGGGGSSYISGYAGVNSVNESTTISHSNQTLHYSGKYFIGGSIIEWQNEGNGYANIKFVGSKPSRKTTKLNNVRYIKNCIKGSTANTGNHWVELQAIKDGINIAKGKNVTGTTSSTSPNPYNAITDGDITTSKYGQSSTSGNQCITIDLGASYDLDEIAVWTYFGDYRSYYDNKTYVSSNNTNFEEIINDYMLDTSNGHRINAYTETYNGYKNGSLLLWYDGFANTGTTKNYSSTVWKDLSGKGNNGNLTRATWYNKYLYFDGTNDYVQSISNLGISGNANLTMCTVASWQGATWSTGYPSYMGIVATGSLNGLAMTMSNGNPALDFWNYRYRASSALEVKKTYQICMTKTSGSVNSTSNIYINGTLVEGSGNSTSSPNITNAKAVVGRLDATRWANANIYSVRYYNKALTEDEITYNYFYDKQRFNLE